MPNTNVTILERPRKNGAANIRLRVKCNHCGKELLMWESHYYRGDNPCDCGHLRKKNARLHRIWSNMKTRCLNSNNPSYANYGGKGISISNEWSNSFEAFLNWSLANGYCDGLTIDRIDNSRGYEPSNCRWATVVEQANNKTNNITVDGRSLRRYCIENGLPYKLIHQYAARHTEMTMLEVIDRYKDLKEKGKTK